MSNKDLKDVPWYITDDGVYKTDDLSRGQLIFALEGFRDQLIKDRKEIARLNQYIMELRENNRELMDRATTEWYASKEENNDHHLDT